VTLTTLNATSTGAGAAVTYTFEVATDAGFANKMATKTVPQAAGQTSVTLDPLPADKTYYWRVRATAGATSGAYTTPIAFTIGPAVLLEAVSPVAPVAGEVVESVKPTLTVSNAARTGPAGSLTYRFEIARDAAFSDMAVTGSVGEGASETSFTPNSNLGYRSTYYWRARAIDSANDVVSPYSNVRTFVTPVDPGDLWPGQQPPGTLGHAIKGDNWQEQDLISFGGVRFHSPTLEMKRLFDLFDRDMEPQEAIDWMHDHGYPTNAAYYPRVEVIGIQYVYLAFINGRWDVVLRAEGE
jgi:hypothetical protein